MEEKTYKIYSVKKYSGMTNNDINAVKKEYTIKRILEKIEDDNGYHIRIDPEKNYIFFGDVDGHLKKIKDFSEFLVQFFKNKYSLNIFEEDIKFTKNESKVGSYHYSIPSLFCSCKKMKEIVGNMKTEYEKIYNKDKVIDTSIYSKHWFRLPNQYKEGIVGTEHLIVRGDLIDFFPEYIPENSTSIENNKYIGKELYINQIEKEQTIDIDKIQKGKFERYEIKKLVNMLSDKRLNDYNNWLNVGMCLKNINSDYLEIWDRWSEKGKEYDETCCEKKWKTFNKDSDKKLGMGSLIKWANDDNKESFKNFLSERNIKQIIKTNKKQFPNNELEVDKIIQNNDFHYVGLKDKFCPFYDDEHSEGGNVYLDLVFPDRLSMKCHKCVGKAFPCNHIKLKNSEAKTIFNTLVVNNYYNEEENLDFEIVKIIEDEKLNKLIFDVLNYPTDVNYSKIVHYLYPDKFIYDVDTWYEFKNHRWVRKRGDNIEFKKKSLSEISTLLKKCLEYFKDDKKAVSHIKKQIKNIEDSVGRKNIMNLISEEFSYSGSNIDQFAEEGEFFKKMDKNPYLIGFTNGVYDLKNFKFRDGIQTDFISMTVGYPYIDKYSEKINEIKKFFKDIQPDKEQREFLLTFLGSCLLGLQKDEIYTIFTGATRNGKTTCTDLLKITLGNDYYGTIDSTYLTRPCPESGKPNPEVLNLEKKRVVITSENEANNKLNTGHVKKITGGDDIDGRNMYSNEIVNFKPQFKLISLFNQIPDVDKLDGGFWSRCKVVDFPTTFVEKPENPNELPIDKDLKSKLKEWKQDFMLLLIEYCEKYIKYGLKFPKSVEKETEKYKRSVDCYENYVSECLENDNKDAVSWKEIKSHFCYWYKDNIDDKIPNAKEIKRNFEKKLKKNIAMCKNQNNESTYGWKGYTFKKL